MSTKIYDGLRTTVFDNPFNIANKMRAVMEPLFFARFVDEIPPGGHGEIFENYEKMQKAFDSVTRSFEDPAMDFGYNVTLLPNGLVLVFSEFRGYRDDLLAAGIVEDYGYWDNGDKPDDVTAKRWRNRKKEWSVIFDEPPAQVGLQFFHPDQITTVVEANKILRNKTTEQ